MVTFEAFEAHLVKVCYLDNLDNDQNGECVHHDKLYDLKEYSQSGEPMNFELI